MTTFVAVYEGKTVGQATMKHLSADPALIFKVVTALLYERERMGVDRDEDPVIAALEQGRTAALLAIQQECQPGGDAA